MLPAGLFETDPFRAIADANRRRVLDMLHERPRSVGELVEQLGVSQPAVSQQLNVLRAAGLVKSERGAAGGSYRWPATGWPR